MKNDKITKFGISLEREVYLKIKKRLEELEEKSPANSSIHLEFDRRAENIKGRLTIRSLYKTFKSEKIAFDPMIAFMLMIDDIEKQLLQWKKRRFTQSNVNLNYA
ncbi:MAG: hypothetical protein Fur0010_11330 [Bdellovibrio sp.]